MKLPQVNASAHMRHVLVVSIRKCKRVVTLGNTYKNKRVLIEAIHKDKFDYNKQKALAEQQEARKQKARAAKERKAARKAEEEEAKKAAEVAAPVKEAPAKEKKKREKH